MTQHFNNKEENLVANNNTDRSNPQSVQVNLRLRAVEKSDRAVVSNISMVQPSSGLVYIDFGFLEQQMMDQIGNAARAGESNITIDGRLECRIAMTPENMAQLARQLNQVLAAPNKPAHIASSAEPLTVGPDTVLQ